MTIREAFLAALFALGRPVSVGEIHVEHRRLGGRFSHQAFRTCAWDLARAGQIERTNTTPPYIYTLSRNARARMSRAAA